MSDSDDCCEIIEPTCSGTFYGKSLDRRTQKKRAPTATRPTAAPLFSGVDNQKESDGKEISASAEQGLLPSGADIAEIAEGTVVSTTAEQEPVNPFASFAFGGGGSLSSASTTTVVSEERGGHLGCSKRGTSSSSGGNSLKMTRGSTASLPPSTCKKSKKNCLGEKKDWPKGDDLSTMSAEELRAVRARWRGKADRRASEEDQRFQVVVAAVMSSRAQGTVVAEALERLRAREGGLTVRAMAAIEQDELASILRSVHWNKAKSKYIREGAELVLRRHHGTVPRRKADILALPGVGPALGEILLAVFDSWEADNEARAATAPDNDPSIKTDGGNKDSEEKMHCTGLSDVGEERPLRNDIHTCFATKGEIDGGRGNADRGAEGDASGGEVVGRSKRCVILDALKQGKRPIGASSKAYGVEGEGGNG